MSGTDLDQETRLWLFLLISVIFADSQGRYFEVVDHQFRSHYSKLAVNMRVIPWCFARAFDADEI